MRRIRAAASAILTVSLSLVLSGIPASTARAAATATREVQFRLRDLKLIGREGQVRVDLRGAPNRALPGEPELPMSSIAVEIPAGARVTGWQVLPLEVVDVPAPAHLAPVKSWMTSAGHSAGPAAARPADTEWFPVRPYGQLQTGFLQGHTIASIAVRPLQYLPGEARLRLISRFRLVVNYEATGGPAPLARVRRTERTELAAVRALGTLGISATPRPNVRVGRSGIFPASAGQYPAPFGREAAYVIVTADSLASSFQPLADWKTRQGMSAKVVTTSQIQSLYPQGADLPEKIRMYLQDAYRYQGTQWLLLGGGASIIPPRFAYSQLLRDAPVPTDMYFSNLDGNWNANGNSLFAEVYFDSTSPGDSVDFYPEIYVGRAPVSNASEASLFVAKTLTYDQNPPRDYLNRQLMCAEVESPADFTPGDYIIYDGAILTESVASRMPAYNSIVKLYENNDQVHFPGCIYETRQTVLDSINSGFNLIMDSGHGFRNSMSVGGGILLNADMRALANGPEYSFMIALDCTAAAFDFDCIGAAAVTAPAGGAFAFWGSTREDFPEVTLNYVNNYFDQVNADSSREIGQALALCRVPFVSATDEDNPDRWTQFAFILFGDPSLRLRVRPASTFSVAAPSSFVMGDAGYTVSVTSGGAPAESALVCVYKPGDDLEVAYTDANGSVTLPFQPDSLGNFQVTVTGRDAIPYLGGGTVAARTGAYLFDASATKLILDGSAAPQAGNGNGAVDAGETIQLGVTVGNRGGLGAGGVVGTLSTSAPGVTILASAVSYGTIPAGGTSTGSGTYAVQFARSLPGAARVPFTLHLADSQGDTRDDYFTLPLGAPVPEMYSTAWTDSVAGSTHYTLLRIALRNIGNGAFRGLAGKVRPVAGSFVPLDSVSDYGDLAPGASAIGSACYRFQGQAAALSRFYLFLTDAYGEADTLNFDLQPPHYLSGVGASGSQSSITLTWLSAADSASVAGYYVYRSLSAAGPFARVSSRHSGRTRYFSDFGLAPLTPYFYYVTAVDSGGMESAPSGVATASTNPAYHSGWPVTTGREMAGSPILVNFTHQASGALDIWVGSDALYSWHHDANELRDGDKQAATSGVWLKRGAGYPSSLAVSDLFQDGKFCIVGVSQDSGNVFVWDEDGNVKPGWPHRFLGGFPFGSPAIGDIDGDGKPEIVVGCGTSIYAWHADGTEVVDGDLNPATNGIIRTIGGSYIYGSPALADLDHDGKADIIIGGSDNRMHAIKSNGTECRGWPFLTAGAITGSAAVGDLKLDGHNEVVFPSVGNQLYCLSDTGTILTGWPISMRLDRTSRSPSPALADLNQDGYLDVVEATTDGYLRAVDRSGVNLPGWASVRYAQAYAAYAGTSESSPIVADLNGDGHLEVLQGAEDAYFYGFNDDGTTLAGFPIRLGGEVRGTPAAWDLANNGQTNIVLSDWDKNVYVWDYPGGFSRARAPWPMFRHDDQHTGYYKNPNIITAVERAEFGAVAGPDGIRLDWDSPLAPEGRVTWNVYRREDAGASASGGAAGTLTEIPADFVKVSDVPIADQGRGGSYLDGDVRGGRTYVYVLETLVGGQRRSLLGPVTRVVPDKFLPARAALFQNTPNPFHRATSIRFQVPVGLGGGAGVRVRLTLHDVSGRLVRTLADGDMAAGTYARSWDGRDGNGAPAASGVYFYRLVAGGESLTRKLLRVGS